jgi:hypothetical protein
VGKMINDIWSCNAQICTTLICREQLNIVFTSINNQWVMFNKVNHLTGICMGMCMQILYNCNLKSPFSSGQSCPIVLIGPRPVNCPIESSMKSIGIPQRSIVMKYGNKKTPKDERKAFQFISIFCKTGSGWLIWILNSRLFILIVSSSHLRPTCTWCMEIERHYWDRPSIRCTREQNASYLTSTVGVAYCRLHRHWMCQNFQFRKYLR